jgi:hypothetical protein
MSFVLSAVFAACGSHDRASPLETRIEKALDREGASPVANVGDKYISSFRDPAGAVHLTIHTLGKPAWQFTEVVRLVVVFGQGPRISGDVLWLVETERQSGIDTFAEDVRGSVAVDADRIPGPSDPRVMTYDLTCVRRGQPVELRGKILLTEADLRESP